MAEAVSVGVAPHNPLGPIAGVAALHFAISTPNHVIQEEMVGAVPWYFDVVQGPIRMVDGFWQIPEAPGLGIEVDEAECAAASLCVGSVPHAKRRAGRRDGRGLVTQNPTPLVAKHLQGVKCEQLNQWAFRGDMEGLGGTHWANKGA